MKQKIKINIADRIYTLTIEASREEAMRKAVKNINEAIGKYKSRMSNIDEVDALGRSRGGHDQHGDTLLNQFLKFLKLFSFYHFFSK